MVSYSELTEWREFNQHGVEKLLWAKSDKGAFGNENDGPMFDWMSEHEEWLKHSKEKRIAIQAGGCCGMYPRLYSIYFEYVYTFEPTPLNFYCLVNNCPSDNVIKMQCGLGDSNIPLEIQGRHNSSNVGTYVTKENSSGNIPQIRIDQLNLNTCSLIHLDAEGAEENILKGAKETIDKFRPTIITERARGKDWLTKNFGYEEVFKGRMDSIFISDK